MDTERFFFLWIFHVVPLEFQWIIALFMPLSRELNAFCLTKLSNKIVGNRDGSAELIATNLGKGSYGVQELIKIKNIFSKCPIL